MRVPLRFLRELLETPVGRVNLNNNNVHRLGPKSLMDFSALVTELLAQHLCDLTSFIIERLAVV